MRNAVLFRIDYYSLECEILYYCLIVERAGESSASENSSATKLLTLGM